MTDKLDIVIIELEKLDRNKGEKRELKEWCEFIKNPEKMEETSMNNDIRKAKEELDKISQDEREIRLAELREKAVKDEMAIRDSGYKEGIKKGRDKAIEEIVEKMLEKGIDEKIIAELVKIEDDEINYNDLKDKFLEKENEIYHIVKAMLKENLDINLISRVTVLTDEEIKAIK